jgi:glutamate-ammonia-ligase adenylyltransferase
MGYATEAAFEQALSGHRERVAELFGGLLGAAGATAGELDPELALLADPDVEPERRAAIAARRGLADPERSLAAIDAMARRRTPFARLGDVGAAVALLEDALGTPDPDQALGHLADFATALRNPEPYFDVLRQRRRASRLLLSLFGTSDFLSKRFIRHPELIDALLREDARVDIKDAAAFRRELADRLALLPAEVPVDVSLEDELSELRRYRNEEILRIGLADIAGYLELPAVTSQLTDLAEACLDRCLDAAEREARSRGNVPPDRLCVVGLGKLGGRELGYHSDLDLIFLYPSGPPEAHPLYARVAQRFIAFLQMPLREGRLYQIDTRLRPSGNQGALVVGVDGFAHYHLGDDGFVRSQLWERQALLRARHVAGDPSPFREVEERVIVPVVYGRREDRTALSDEIRRMRERMESEIGREAARGRNPKTGLGGLVDVEFAAQFLQLLHGHDHPAVRTPSTPAALDRLRAAGLLADEPYRALSRGYEFLRRVELRLRIVHDFAIDHLPDGGPALDQLARRLGWAGPEPGERFLAEYGRVTRAVRAAFDAVVR